MAVELEEGPPEALPIIARTLRTLLGSAPGPEISSAVQVGPRPLPLIECSDPQIAGRARSWRKKGLRYIGTSEEDPFIVDLQSRRTRLGFRTLRIGGSVRPLLDALREVEESSEADGPQKLAVLRFPSVQLEALAASSDGRITSFWRLSPPAAVRTSMAEFIAEARSRSDPA